jgi:hypothetical protein
MKIAILGACETSLNLAPFKDPQWDIWACSPGTLLVPRVTYRFELHRMSTIIQQYGTNIDVLRAYPTYMQEAFTDFPNAIVYPKDRIVERWGKDWLTSSVAWMLALAIEHQPEEIGIWGVDMNGGQEYAAQRPGCLYFIEKAKEHGIKVFVPDESLLLKTSKLYGYE